LNTFGQLPLLFFFIPTHSIYILSARHRTNPGKNEHHNSPCRPETQKSNRVALDLKHRYFTWEPKQDFTWQDFFGAGDQRRDDRKTSIWFRFNYLKDNDKNL